MSSLGILELLKKQENPQPPPLNENAVNGIKNILNMAKNSKDPTNLIQMLSAQNPNMQKAIDYVKANGGDPKTAFQTLAAQNGIDADAVDKLIHK